MEFRVLGPIEVVADHGVVPVEGVKGKTALAALLLAHGRVVSDAQLSDVMWGPKPPTTVHQQIYSYISRLRKLVTPETIIVRKSPGYVLRRGTAGFDCADFNRLASQGYADLRRENYEDAAEHLGAALSLWRGPALADVTDYLAAAELTRLEEARMAALEGRFEADLALGRHGAVVTELSGLVDAHPLRERLRAQLMTALCRCGRQADALAVYRRGRQVLADEIGVDPSSALNDVFQAILASDEELTSPRVPPQTIRGGMWRRTRPAMLPADLADFSGRERALLRVRQELRGNASNGPVVITGMAGAGKSALAVHAAHALSQDFPDGQLYVDLEGMGRHPKDPCDVLEWFLQALGEPEGEVPPSHEERVQLYRSVVAAGRFLILLDHAADEQQVRPLLPGGSRSRVIVTSRSRLSALAGTSVVDLDGFEQSEALALLAAVVGEQRVTAEPRAAEYLVALCERLPLAVRVVAARLAAKPHWSLSQMVARMAAEERGSRLDQMRLSDLNVRASVEQSYLRLDEVSQKLLCCLALMRAPEAPPWAAAAVLGIADTEAQDLLETLVDARMLTARRTDDGSVRYVLHPLVRLFAAERGGGEHHASERLSAVDGALVGHRERAESRRHDATDLSGRARECGRARDGATLRGAALDLLQH